MPVATLPGIRRGTNCFYGRDGHGYHINKFVKGGRVSLRCAQYGSLQCRGRASSSTQGRSFKQTQPHNHVTEPETKEARLFRAAVLARCQTDGRTDLHAIYHQERVRLEVSNEAASVYPYGRLRNAMVRARQENLPNLPHTLSELKNILKDDRYQHLTKSVNSEGSVYAGTFGRTDQRTRCTIFASRKQRKYMRCKKLFCDATFGSIPAGLDAAQVWNLTTKRRGRSIPLARVVMQTKEAACYAVALRALQQLAPGFSPDTCNCDFELAQRKEVKRAFPNCRVRGCLFHYTKNVIKRGRSFGLTRHMRDDDVVEMADIAELDIATLNAGRTPSSRQRKASALANDERIKAFSEELAAGDISVGTFLRRASRRLKGAIDNFLRV